VNIIMKGRVFLVITAVGTMILMAGTLYAAPKIGVGFILGDPSGLTAKAFLGDNDAVDIGVGPGARDGFYLYGDYLRHFGNVFPVPELALYLGFGAGLHNRDRDDRGRGDDDDENSLEARLPLGIEYTVRRVPLGVFLELAPALEVIPDFDFHLRGGLGVRYYF